MGKSKIRLFELVSQMEIQMDEMPVYFNQETGEFVFVEERFFGDIEDGMTKEDYSQDWQKEAYEQAKDVMVSTSDKYLRIPSNFDIHEWEIMKDFCYTIDDENIRGDLLNAIHGRGAFRMFKDKIIHYGIRQDWFDFRKEQFAEIARRWCESHDLEYVEESI